MLFWDFKISVLDVVVHAFCMGVVIEGVDYYGIGELELIIIQDRPEITMFGAFCCWVVPSLFFLLFIVYTTRKEIGCIQRCCCCCGGLTISPTTDNDHALNMTEPFLQESLLESALLNETECIDQRVEVEDSQQH